MEFLQKSLEQAKEFLGDLSPNTRLLVVSLLVVLGLTGCSGTGRRDDADAVMIAKQKADLSKSKSKTEAAKIVGKHIADKAKEKKIEKVVFDRGGFLYHGRVQAVAEGARENGLVF